MKQLLIIIAVLLVIPASALGKGKVIDIEMTVSGTVLHVSDVRTFYDVNLKGTPGSANARGAGDGYPSDLPGTPCPDIGPFDGLRLDPAQINVVFNDGSMFYGKIIVNDSYVCFAAPLARASYEIVGGTGRFEGAVGYIVIDLETYPIEAARLATPETGYAYGEIILP